jgi:two-component system, OmpR family, sensor histidine kinase QseC
MTGRQGHWSLRRRLLVSLVALTALLFAVSATQNYFVSRDTSRRLFDDSLRESARLLLQLAHHEIAEHGQILGLELLKAETQPGPYGFQFQIWTSDMRAGYRSASLPTTPLLPFHADGYGWTEIHGERWRAYAAWDNVHSLQIQIAQSQRQRQALNRDALLRAVVSVGLLLAAASGLIWWILTRSIRPLQRTASTVGERSEFDLRAIETAGAPAEVQPLLVALNRLLGRIRNTLQLERRFTADASHELRTPLAAIRANAQALVGARDAGERDSTARDLIASVDPGARLVEQLLALARADAALRPDSVVAVELSELALEQVITHTPLAVKQGVALVSTLQPAMVSGDPALLAVLLRNLLENALRHTPQGGVVTVTTGADASGVLLEVEDTGPGIAPGERERVFERFYRVAGPKATGSGLGLSIAQRIVELHGASITILEGSGGQGARLRITFPTRESGSLNV